MSWITSAAEKGANADRIMDHTGHRSHAMVRVYTRRCDAFAGRAASKTPSEVVYQLLEHFERGTELPQA